MGARSLRPASRCGALSASNRHLRRGANPPVTGPFTLAVDAMGGDRAPDVVVEGLDFAAERHPAARFLLVGDEARLQPLLLQHKRAAGVCTVRHTADVIGNDTRPTAALRMRGASMRVAVDAVAGGE